MTDSQRAKGLVSFTTTAQHSHKPQISRLLSSAYCSALLQAVTADTEDLQDMYSAQLSCIQEARLGKGVCVFVLLAYVVCVLCVCVTVQTQEDLQDMYSAQLSCIQEARLGKGVRFVTIPRLCVQIIRREKIDHSCCFCLRSLITLLLIHTHPHTQMRLPLWNWVPNSCLCLTSFVCYASVDALTLRLTPLPLSN